MRIWRGGPNSRGGGRDLAAGGADWTYTQSRPPGAFAIAPGGPVGCSLTGLHGLSRRLPRGAGVQDLGQLFRYLVEGSSESFDACSMDACAGYCDTRWGGLHAHPIG